jgi:hypothetical protein
LASGWQEYLSLELVYSGRLAVPPDVAAADAGTKLGISNDHLNNEHRKINANEKKKNI